MTTKAGGMEVKHSSSCDSECRAGEGGIQFAQEAAPGQRGGCPAGKWIAYYVHDERPCPDDPEQWRGAWFQVLAESKTETGVRAAIAGVL